MELKLKLNNLILLVEVLGIFNIPNLLFYFDEVF